VEELADSLFGRVFQKIFYVGTGGAEHGAPEQMRDLGLRPFPFITADTGSYCDGISHTSVLRQNCAGKV
jgi:hypothetical protein